MSRGAIPAGIGPFSLDLHAVNGLQDPLIRDGIRRPQGLGEERDPQLFEHPADIAHLHRHRLPLGQLVDQLLVLLLHRLHLEHIGRSRFGSVGIFSMRRSMARR